ncbi:hypothetical protein ACFO25_07300 [Paenactinomyces guangxiensis]|uniref:Uncharacterized protein n=1 Tax=Paenactinomyces guangxiensis TaxID=1490290 RepID=A0A7W1WNI0_9BACL|nr:hypothetical protein [Paenactinomyces guangxiensis]MBA4493146.1 hypothetical protein [Paenactinomyces guangxiensis]MBH8590004.1 hypothetical protein [Paenactinomyces guangxiensis]
MLNEARLRNLIRRILKEELAHVNDQNDEHEWETNQKPCAVWSKEPVQHEKKWEELPLHQQTPDEAANAPWAVFGSPKPVSGKPAGSKQERPRALPGWSEPYRPDFSNFDAPPYMPKKPMTS